MLGQMLLKIRTATHPAPVVPLSRQELHAIAPTLAPVSIDMVGLYATFTQAVGRRTAEIGVGWREGRARRISR